MSLWKKATNWFTGINDPIGNGNKTIPQTEEAKTETHERFGSVMIGKGLQQELQDSHKPESTKDISSAHSTQEIKQTHISKILSLDVLDLTRVIDIYAESRAVEAFDAEMGKERKGAFQKMKGFFARSFQRMGRDAWIDTKKREYIATAQAGLKNGTYSESFLREHIASGDTGIMDNAYLGHEEIQKENSLPANIQSTVDTWMATSVGSPERAAQTVELKRVIEGQYPTVTADLSQLEASLLRLERAKISSEVDTIEAKLNILDIGRIEQGNGKRKEGWFVKMSDSIQDGVNRSKLPDWVKQKIIGTIRHPNTAAVLTALGTRAGVGMIAGATVAAGFSGGFLLPIIVGSTAGGLFAGVRAHREMRDRTAQIDRRGALGLQTGNKSVDGESSNTSHETNRWQHPAMDLYNRVRAGKNNPENMEDALISGIYYLVKHRVGREQGINMLQYDADKSVSRQHVEMIRLMNTVFPGLVASFNDGSLFDPANTSHEAEKTRELYAQIESLATSTMENRMKEESQYALKQGAIFGTTALVVGGTIGAAVHGLMSGSSGQWIGTNTPGSSTIHYPDNLQAYSNVHRGFWYDNGTPAPKFDHTELMIHTDKTGGWNISHMLSKTASTLHHGSHTVLPTDFIGKNIQAVITPIKGGPSFMLPIDAQGNIQIPPSMQSAFASKSFAWLEVGEVKIGTDGLMNLNPIATVVGKGNMIFDTITEIIPGTNSQEWVAGDAPWVGVPFGGNKYHEIKKTNPKEPIGAIITELPPNTIVQEDPTPAEPIPAGPIVENPNQSTGDNEGEGEPISPPPTQSPTPPIGVAPTTEGAPEELTDNDDLFDGNIDDSEKSELTNEKEKIDTLWNEIVKIRQTLERRKNGTISLSESAVANMQDTLTKLLDEYHKQRKIWNEKIKDMQNIPEDISVKKSHQDQIQNLIDNKILATKNGKPMMMNWLGRIIVAIQTSNGGIIPFYRSCNGTDGKKKGGWFPCFGITDSESWLIKGSLKGMNSGHGIQELKNIQHSLNTHFNWNSDLDSDFFWNKDRNPLVQAGAIIDDSWIKQEESKQASPKPNEHDDGLSTAWILEWLTRVTKPSEVQAEIEEESPIPTQPTPSEQESPETIQPQSDIQSDIDMYTQYEAATRVLGNTYEVDNRIDGWIQMANGTNDPNFVLKGEDHRMAINTLFDFTRKHRAKSAIKVINSFYAKSGKIWVSDKTQLGYSNNYAIAIGLQEDGSVDELTHAIYQIGGVSPMPGMANRVLFHELGHYVTMAYNPPNKQGLIDEIDGIRDEQGVGLVPLSSQRFYDEQARQNPGANTHFWEDMAELMGLYLMGREYVVRYLDDRINYKRSMKANITEGLRDRILDYLDGAYGYYTR